MFLWIINIIIMNFIITISFLSIRKIIFYYKGVFMFTVELKKQLLDCLFIRDGILCMLNNPFGVEVNAVRESCTINLGQISWLDNYIDDEILKLLVVDYIKTKELKFDLMDERTIN